MTVCVDNGGAPPVKSYDWFTYTFNSIQFAFSARAGLRESARLAGSFHFHPRSPSDSVVAACADYVGFATVFVFVTHNAGGFVITTDKNRRCRVIIITKTVAKPT